jgi:hypothetical protein
MHRTGDDVLCVKVLSARGPLRKTKRAEVVGKPREAKTM